MRRAFLSRLARDRRGATIIEFAIIAPTMCVLIMGLSDLAYQAYVQSILTGAVQKAGRDSTIQGAASKSDAIDTAVMTTVKTVAKGATYTSSRKNYSSFSNIKPETPVDNNPANGIYDEGRECFYDVNGNNQRDLDPGIIGQGGANDVVVYSIQVKYGRLFPLAGLMGWGNVVEIGASTVLKNQPYAAQNAFAEKLVCPPAFPST